MTIRAFMPGDKVTDDEWERIFGKGKAPEGSVLDPAIRDLKGSEIGRPIFYDGYEPDGVSGAAGPGPCPSGPLGEEGVAGEGPCLYDTDVETVIEPPVHVIPNDPLLAAIVEGFRDANEPPPLIVRCPSCMVTRLPHLEACEADVVAGMLCATCRKYRRGSAHFGYPVPASAWCDCRPESSATRRFAGRERR